VKPLEIAGPALARVRTADGETHLCLWREGELWDLDPLSLDELLRLPLAETVSYTHLTLPTICSV